MKKVDIGREIEVYFCPHSPRNGRLSEHRPHPEAVPAEPTLEDAYLLEVGVEHKPSATPETSVR